MRLEYIAPHDIHYFLKSKLNHLPTEYNYDIYTSGDNDIRIIYEYNLQFDYEPNEEKLLKININNKYYQLKDDNISIENIKNILRKNSIEKLFDEH